MKTSLILTVLILLLAFAATRRNYERTPKFHCMYGENCDEVHLDAEEYEGEVTTYTNKDQYMNALKKRGNMGKEAPLPGKGKKGLPLPRITEEACWCANGEHLDVWGVCLCNLFIGSSTDCDNYALSSGKSCNCTDLKWSYIPDGEFSTGGCSVCCQTPITVCQQSECYN